MDGDARIARKGETAAARRRRPPAAGAAPAPAAWPAFPGEPNPSGKSSPGTTCKSPKSSMNHGTVASRSKSSCCNCNSCRPSFHSHHRNQQPPEQNQNQNNPHGSSRRIVYDDVFGGPPRSVSSPSTSKEKKLAGPDYDDIFRPTSSPKPATKSRITAELPVFDPPEYCRVEVFKSDKSSAEVAYDDVFGGPLTGPRTKFLKDLLKCSGNSKWKSDSSPSMQSTSHGNPVYEFDNSDVFGARKNPSSKLYTGSRPAAMTSLSGCSSPFTEQGDASTVNSFTVNSYSPSVSKEPVQVRYDKIYRNVSQAPEAEIEVDSPSSSGSFELDFQERGSFTNFGKVRMRQRSSRKSTGTKVTTPVSSNEIESTGIPNITVRTGRDIHERDIREGVKGRDIQEDVKEVSFESEIRSFLEEAADKETTQEMFVNNVKVAPPPKQAVHGEGLSENELSELFESEAFMEYSIRDLDGLMAEEYIVSHESLSESSPSSVSVTNSLKTSPSYEAEGSDCSGVNNRSDKASGRDKKPARRASQKQQLHERVEQMENRKDMLEKVFDNAKGDVKVDTGAKEEHVFEEEPRKTGTEMGLSSSSLSAEVMERSREDSGPSSSSSFGDMSSFKVARTSDEWSSVCEFEEIEGETPERRKSRWERHQRASERVAKALAEKFKRDEQHDRVQVEKQRVAEILEDDIKRWAAGKQGNVRALLSTLQYILWPESGWRAVSLMDIIEPVSVRKAYRKATLCVHPDKLQQKGASVEHKYIAEKVFDHLQEAWTVFNYEQLF